MSENVIQTSFTGGELAPSIDARVDIGKYKSGAALLRNFFVDYRSGASTRTGTKFVIQCLVSDKPVRLIEFQYSVITTYVLEFGDQYIRFINDGGAVLESNFNISDANNGNPAQITAVGHNYLNDDWVFVSGIVGATLYNGRFYKVTVSGDVLTLYTVNGTPVNAANFGTYISGGTVARVYKIPSPYLAADLALLKYTQSASVLTITHPNYATRNLIRNGAADWELQEIDFETDVAAPTGAAMVASGAGTANYSYVITALDANGQESLASTAATGTGVNIQAVAGAIQVTWNAVAGAQSYNIYRANISLFGAVPAGAIHGYQGNANGTEFHDTNIVPDFSITPPIAYNPFDNDNFPSVTGYFQQRQVYASPTASPLTFYMSQPGQFNNFNYSHPIQEDDSIEGTIVSGQVNNIKSMVALPGGLLMLTAKGAWQISGGSNNEAVTPINITATPQAYNGISDVRPLIPGNNILFVQEKGSTVRDMQYNFYNNIYTGMDISVLANHLFFGYQITDWAYAEEPYKIVHAVRNDGVMLVLCYVKEQEIFGWTHYDTLGSYESVASITEDNNDITYVIVKRLIGGIWVQMIERFQEREFEYGAEDAWAVDCGARSELPTPAANITVSGITGNVIFTADAPVFTSADVGKVLRMGGGIANITSFTSSNIISGTLVRDIQNVITDTNGSEIPLPVDSGDWSLTEPSTTLSGLDHLNGQTVSILGDGGVVAPQVVVDGQITLPQPMTKVVAGLGFKAQLQTLRLDVGDPTIQGKRKKINALTTRCVNTRGLKIGPTFDDLVPNKELPVSIPMGQPAELITGDTRMNMTPTWNTEGQICIEISDPLPATILGVIPEITVGDTVK